MVTTNSLFVVVLPPKVEVVFHGKVSGFDMCGYHWDIEKKLFYCVLPYPCETCAEGRNPIDLLTINASHEICEAITDPVYKTGWVDGGSEIADICGVGVKKEGKFWVQQVWSNMLGKCK